MVLKCLVTLLAASSVGGQRFGSDPKTWSPSKKMLTCDQCMYIVNKTESTLVSQACFGLRNEERIICNDITSLAVESFSPEVVCTRIGYCHTNNFWLFR